jgi:hypothetical protein
VFLMSLLVSLVIPLQCEGCVVVEVVEINVIIAQFESSFFSGFCHNYSIIPLCTSFTGPSL